MIRAALCTSRPTYFGGTGNGSPVWITHPHSIGSLLRPLRLREPCCASAAAGDRITRTPERNKERVALVIDLVAAMPLERLPQQPPM